MFPLQIGGLLVSNLPGRPEIRYKISEGLLRHIKNVLSACIDKKEVIINNRISNYRFLRNQFEQMNAEIRFELTPGTVPAVFMFSTEKLRLDLPELKKYYYAHGVQCSVFYGEDTFFIPLHQSLTEQDMIYFTEVFRSFMHLK